MKIVFICGSIEPGKDGVGDYTRRLAGEIIRQGHHASIIAMNDRHVSVIQQTSQIDNDIEINILRIPSIFNNSSKTKVSKEFIHRHNPEWLSLQYVPFSFHPKGLHFGLSNMLFEIGKNRKWHIMFHEIWVDIWKHDSFKYRIWGALQRFTIQNIFYKIMPILIHSNSPIYKQLLDLKFDTKCLMLPLFSHFTSESGFNNFHRSSINNISIQQIDFFNVVMLGHLHPVDNVRDFLFDLVSFFNDIRKDFKLIHIGRTGDELLSWIYHTKEFGINFDVLGESTISEVNEVIRNSNLGVTTTAIQMIHKSSSVAALREQDIPIICLNVKNELKHFLKYSVPNGIHIYQRGFITKDVLRLIRSDNNYLSLKSVSQVFLDSLNNLKSI